MTSPDSTYAKPFLTVPEQIRRLRDRGMDCRSDAFASGILERYGYYRLSGYSHLYRERPAPPAPQVDDAGREIRLDSFVNGTNLVHVVALYEFDHELRTRLSGVLSAIETSFRFFIGHRVGRINRFAHRHPELLGTMRQPESETPSEPTTAYNEWLEEFDRHEKRARDVFVLHFRDKYGPHLPIWVATEVMSFGVLSNLFSLIPQLDQEILAARFQINAADGRGDRIALANWLNNLRNVRNICAHYGRLWNRTFDVLIDTPGQAKKENNSHLARLLDGSVNNKLYGVLLIMRHMLLSIAPDRMDVVDLADFIDTQSRHIPFRMGQLGFPDEWRSDRIWDRAFVLGRVPMLAASLIDHTVCLTAPQTRAALTAARPKMSDHDRTPEQTAAAHRGAQKSLLRAYIHFRVIIEIELGGTKFYPSFQFRDGKIIDALAEINKALTEPCVDSQPIDVAAALLHWWQTPHPVLPKDEKGVERSPLDLLEDFPEAEFTKVIDEADATNSFVILDESLRRSP